MRPAGEARGAKGPVLGAAYFATFAALGTYGPFLAIYLAYRGFTPFEVAGLLATLPLLRIVAAPAWTFVADVRQSSAWVLRVVAVGSVVSFALIDVAPTQAALGAALVAFTIFRAPSTSLLDVLALAWSRRVARAFGPLRAWGTAGYTLAAFAVGVFVSRFGPRAIVHGSVLFLALTALATFGLPAARSSRGDGESAVAGVQAAPQAAGRAFALLLVRPRFALFLATAVLHQVGLAAYDSLFPSYLSGISTPTYAGAAVGVGALAEVVFMARSGPVFARLSHARILAIAYAVSALRWLLVATVTSPVLLVGAQVLHAATFGAFYLASVAFVNDESPSHARASAQGIFQAATWGIGVSLCLGLAAFVQAHAGLRTVFALGAVASIAGCALAFVLERMPPAPDAGDRGNPD